MCCGFRFTGKHGIYTFECVHAAIRSARVPTKDRPLGLPEEENDCCRSVKISEDRKRRRFVDVSYLFFPADAPHRERREPIDYENAFSK